MNAPASNFAEPLFGNVPLASVFPSKTNPRKHFDETALAELAESIKNHGVAQPILLRPLPPSEGMIDSFEIVAGERRYRASKLAGMESIPAIVRELNDLQALEIQVIENLQRQDVHPIEEAEGYDRLMKEHGYTADQLAEKVGKSRSYIYGRLKFSALSERPRAAFFDGKLSASTALLIARIPTANLQEQATDEILAGDHGDEPMSYREAANHIQQRYMLSLSVAPFSLVDVKLVSSAGSCEACPKRTGNQPLLFADVQRADVCTDPDCYAVKRIAHGQKAVALAKKKKIPVYTEEEAEDLDEELEGLASETDLMWGFERRKNDGSGFKKVGELLGIDQRPEPAAYITKSDGSVVQLYDKTAMQEALEKAGLCESLEAYSARVQEKTTPKDPAKAAAQEAARQEAQARQQARAMAAEAATEARVIMYRRIRDAMSFSFTAEALRVIVREMLLTNYNLPFQELPDVYSWESRDDGEMNRFIDQADSNALQLLIMDMVMKPALSVSPWQLNEDNTPDPEEEEAVLLATLAQAAGIPVGEPPAKESTTNSSCEDAATPGKLKSKKKETETVSVEHWPFPTGSRP